MNTLLSVIATGWGLVVALPAVALLMLSIVALKQPAASRPARRPWLLTVIVPAHKEEAGIAETLRSLAADAYEPRPEILVVADNCSDATAAIARDQGATTLERFDVARRGKTYALDYGIAAIEHRPLRPDAYLILDADSIVQPGFFAAIAASLDAGAEVVQAEYRVFAAADARTRLRALAFSLVHYARPLGAKRMGLGMGLKGNGMAFRRELVAHGMPGSGITEDAAAALDLAQRGVAATFEPGAVVFGRMAPSYAAATAQDRRWEGGRLSLVPRAFAVAVRALLRGRWEAAGAALDVAALPFTFVGLLAVAGLGLALAGYGFLWLAVADCGLLGVYPFVGWFAARVPPKELRVLFFAPRFFVHKLLVLASLARSGVPQTWERTERGGEG